MAVSADPAASGTLAAVPRAAAEAAATDDLGNSGDGDVYMANGASSPGVWEAENLLDAEYDASGGSAAYEPHTMSIEVGAFIGCQG